MKRATVGFSFAAIVLGVGGCDAHLRRDWAFRYHGALPQHLEDAIFGTSLKTYGWIYLVLGVLLIICAFAGAQSLTDRSLGRHRLAAIASISAIWWMPYYPIWSLTYVALGVLVIYALVAHGADSEKMAAL